MQVFDTIDALEDLAPGPRHVAVGVFDGVHLGHQELLGGVADAARADGAATLIFTFRNHPRGVLDPEAPPPLISPWPLKQRLLARLGLDAVVALEFTPAFSHTPAEEFVTDILIGRCRARTIHSGVNFRFGRDARGGPDMLARLAPEHGARYHRIEPVHEIGERISSTRVRHVLAAGDTALAARLLGRPHQVDAPVVAGDALGRKIGFPTANLAPAAGLLLPANGVYAAAAFLPGETLARPAMMNIGTRPTVNGRELRTEVHLIGWSGELSGAELSVLVLDRLRDEQRFDSVDALRAQLGRDCDAARLAFEGWGRLERA